MQRVDAKNIKQLIVSPQCLSHNSKNSDEAMLIGATPIIEPLPHYPLSNTVMEMLTYIGELINTQKETSLEAMHGQALLQLARDSNI